MREVDRGSESNRDTSGQIVPSSSVAMPSSKPAPLMSPLPTPLPSPLASPATPSAVGKSQKERRARVKEKKRRAEMRREET